jgi:hypothetical protein
MLKVKALLKLHGGFLSHFYSQLFVYTLLYLVGMVEMCISTILRFALKTIAYLIYLDVLRWNAILFQFSLT